MMNYAFYDLNSGEINQVIKTTDELFFLLNTPPNSGALSIAEKDISTIDKMKVDVVAKKLKMKAGK